jgi:hypothetical protein
VYGTTPANASDVLKTANNRGAVTLPTGAAATAGAQTALALRSAVT